MLTSELMRTRMEVHTCMRNAGVVNSTRENCFHMFHRVFKWIIHVNVINECNICINELFAYQCESCQSDDDTLDSQRVH